MWIRLLSATLAVATVSSGPGGVDLGGVFGVARASATQLDSETIELDIEVEADPLAVVVAHLIEPGGVQDTLPLRSRDSGVFGITTEARRIDYVVVFELVGEVGVQSQPVRLTQLGVALAVLGVVPPTDTEEQASTAEQWGWAGLGLGAAALAFLAFWALPDRRKKGASSSTDAASGHDEKDEALATHEDIDTRSQPETVATDSTVRLET